MKKEIGLVLLVVVLLFAALRAADVDFTGYVIVRERNGVIFTRSACRDSNEFNIVVNRLALANVDSSDLWFYKAFMHFDTTGSITVVACSLQDITSAYRVTYSGL